MANREHLKVLKQGVKAWNEWRKKMPNLRPNLRNAELSDRDFSHGLFNDADLMNADFSGTNLKEANFRSSALMFAKFLYGTTSTGTETILKGGDLKDSRLMGAYFFRTNLSGADLSGAWLWGTIFEEVTLTNADLSKCLMGRTKFLHTDLSQVKGLDTIEHATPSSLDPGTFYMSKGNIPQGFLRGCGIPDNFITYMHSLTSEAFEFYSCFISYSNKNQAFAERLYADLQAKGVRCWYAPIDLRIGETIRIGIDESIRRHDKLLLILSKDSVRSNWVEKEVETALEQERRQNSTVLFPIRLDDAVMKIDIGWPADIRRTRHIGDFRKWRIHEDYRKAFDRLLHDLNAQDS